MQRVAAKDGEALLLTCSDLPIEKIMGKNKFGQESVIILSYLKNFTLVLRCKVSSKSNENCDPIICSMLFYRK